MANTSSGDGGWRPYSPADAKSEPAPLRLSRVLDEELAHVFRDLERRELPHANPATQQAEDENLRAVFDGFHRARPVALCLSGGGIRSATIGLGVIQGLARHGVLDRFHYLSTVSGGGYIGSWLSAWIHRFGRRDVIDTMQKAHVGPTVATESPQVDHLRAYSNYLTPRLGLLSADTWSVVATVVRNLLLNWLVLLPLLAIGVLVPQLWATWLRALADRDGSGLARMDFWGVEVATITAFVAVIVAIAYVVFDLPSGGNRRGTQERFLLLGLAPLVLAAALLTRAWVSIVSAHSEWAWLKNDPMWSFRVLGVFVIVGVVVHAVGATAGYIASQAVPQSALDRTRKPPPGGKESSLLAEVAIVIVSGALGGLGLCAVVRAVPDSTPVLVSAGPPLLLAIFFLATVVCVGLVSRWTNDADREWWARSGGWVLIVALAWLTFATAALAGPFIVGWVRAGVAAAGGLTGVVTYVIAHSAKTVSGRRPDKEATGGWDVAVKIGAPLFLLFLVVAAGWLTEWLPRWWFTPAEITPVKRAIFDLCLLGGLGAVCLVAALTVDVNRFSLHAMYRNRLIRAYLGASRPREGIGCRDPHPFTGFDPDDNLPIQVLRAEHDRPEGPQLPYHVVNVALNLVKGTRLAWQHRKAASFTFTPLHSGSLVLEDTLPEEPAADGRAARRTPPTIKGAYQRSAEYSDGAGVTLGTAVAISGAAVSPNMGYHSSPIVTLLLALFNARLGWWLANPGSAGRRAWRWRGPLLSLRPLLSEAFGLTNDSSKYVYLSDGGHFENLGLYEMVLRRCGTIVLVDGGCDFEHQLEDLGNAVRKIRIDLGIEIDLSPAMGVPVRGSVVHFVKGTIRYADVDKPPARNGTIYYIKPAVSGDESVDVLNYEAAHKQFPHESTGDQWFDEDQFESYRMLGLHSADRIAAELIVDLNRVTVAA